VKSLLIVVVVIAALFLAYRFLLPSAFVSFGRGPINEDSLQILDVRSDATSIDENGQEVRALDEMKFVVIDTSIDAPFLDFDVYDFQLVKGRSEKLGEEENVGDNWAENSFLFVLLDSSGTPTSDFESPTSPLPLRLSFQVPLEATTGYLFYWGVYFGPIQFD